MDGEREEREKKEKGQRLARAGQTGWLADRRASGWVGGCAGLFWPQRRNIVAPTVRCGRRRLSAQQHHGLLADNRRLIFERW